jgi:hypothetical protein
MGRSRYLQNRYESNSYFRRKRDARPAHIPHLQKVTELMG